MRRSEAENHSSLMRRNWGGGYQCQLSAGVELIPSGGWVECSTVHSARASCGDFLNACPLLGLASCHHQKKIRRAPVQMPTGMRALSGVSAIAVPTDGLPRLILDHPPSEETL